MGLIGAFSLFVSFFLSLSLSLSLSLHLSIYLSCKRAVTLSCFQMHGRTIHMWTVAAAKELLRAHTDGVAGVCASDCRYQNLDGIAVSIGQ
jgi:hypothetical protein